MAIAKKAPITLYNETAEDLFVFVGDQRMFIQPYAEETFSFDVAQAFLSQHKGRVKRADDLTIGTRSAVIKPTTMWVANMTGNPELPDTLSVKVRDKKLGMTEQEIPHPAKVARPLVQKALGTWKEQSDAYGNLTSERGFAKYLKIPPYQRVEMPIATGEWFLQRCNAAVFSYNMKVGEQLDFAVQAPKPRDFEPDSSWSLDELRAYMRYIDRSAKLPKSEEDIRAGAAKSNASREEIEFRVAKEKREMLKRLFFRLVQPRDLQFPTREEFLLYMNGEIQPKEKVEAHDILAAAEAESDAALAELAE